jgi:hypothetical protein
MLSDAVARMGDKVDDHFRIGLQRLADAGVRQSIFQLRRVSFYDARSSSTNLEPRCAKGLESALRRQVD